MEYNNTTFTDEARAELERAREILAVRAERAYYANLVSDYEELMEKYGETTEEYSYYAHKASYFSELEKKCEEKIRKLKGVDKR